MISWRSVTAVAAASTLFVSALAVNGVRAARVDLDDAAVWAVRVKDNAADAGRVNTRINALDAVSPSSWGPDLDVLQDGRSVALFDGDSLQMVDAATLSIGGGAGSDVAGVALGAFEPLDSGGGLVALREAVEEVEAAEGTKGTPGGERVRLVPFAELQSFLAAPSTVDGVARRVCAAAVGPSGVAYAVVQLADSSWKLSEVSEEGALNARDDINSALLAGRDANGCPGDLQMVVVGTTPVVMANGRIQINGEVVDENEFAGDEDLRLQQGAALGSSVLVAGASGWFSVDLGTGSVAKIGAGGPGTPVRPARTGDGTELAAWVGASGVRIGQRQGGAEAQYGTMRVTVSNANGARFRLNGRHQVLSVPNDGLVFRFDGDELVTIDNWDEVAELLKRSTEEDQASNPEKQDQCGSGEQDALTLRADEKRIRPKTPTLLSVLDNDSSSSCEPLQIAEIQDQPQGVSLDVVASGGAILATADATVEASDSFEFGYKVGDKSATVKLDVAGPDENDELTFVGGPAIPVKPGGTIKTNVLGLFRDPEGDPIILIDVQEPEGGSVEWQPDGTVSFSAPETEGDVSIDVSVSDAPPSALAPATGTGTLTFSVGGTGQEPKGDIARGAPNVPVRIDVLANDVGLVPGDLVEIDAEAIDGPRNGEASVRLDRVAGVYVFEAAAEGDYSFAYGSGADSGDGAGRKAKVKVTIRNLNPPPAPHAVVDVLRVGRSGSAAVDVLANDDDPSGRNVLVASDVSSPASGGSLRDVAPGSLVARIMDGRSVQVTTNGTEPGTYQLAYTLHSDDAQVTGTVFVIVDDNVANPIVVNDDEAFVIAGATVTAPVLANDRIASGEPLELVPFSDEADGVFAMSRPDGTVRVVAASGATPGTRTFTYQAQAGSPTGVLVVRVQARPGPDAAPAPLDAQDLEARTIAVSDLDKSTPTCIAVPDVFRAINGGVVDPVVTAPDDDTVGAEPGRDSNGACPRAAIAFKATTPGTKQFSYHLEDGKSRSPDASVRVGVVEVAQADPFGVDDEFEVRPGWVRTLDVTANDVSPSGDPITVVEVCPPPADAPFVVTLTKGVVRVDVQDTAELDATGTFGYVVGVPGGPNLGTASSVASRRCGTTLETSVSLTFSEDATAPPIAEDDEVGAVAGKEPVEVDVLANDTDPDAPSGGRGSALNIEISDAFSDVAEVTAGNTVRVTPQPRAQSVVYTVIDADELRASAVIEVPGLEQVDLRLCENAPTPEASVGEETSIDLKGLVCDGARATTEFSVPENQDRIAPAAAGSVQVDGATLRYRPQGATRLVTLNVTVISTAADGTAVTISVPVRILGDQPVNRPPRAVDRKITLQQGETRPGRLQATDPDAGDRLAFSLRGAVRRPGLSLQLDRDGSFEAGADADAEPGSFPVTFVVTDRSDGEDQGTLTIEVLKKERKGPGNSPAITLGEGSFTVVTPFNGLAEDVDWTLDSCRSSDSATTSVKRKGSTSFTVKAESAGEAHVECSWSNSGGNQGTFKRTVTVVGKPKMPGSFRWRDSSSEGCTTSVDATLSWDPVTNAKFYAVEGSKVKEMTETSYTFRKLTLGEGFTTQVRAGVKVPGRREPLWGAWAAASHTPTAPPCWEDPSKALTVDAGKEELTVTWQAATSRSGGNVEYKVLVSAPGFAKESVERGTTTTVSGLTRQLYSVLVKACTGTGLDQVCGETSPVSATPYLPPNPPQNVTLTVDQQNKLKASVGMDGNDEPAETSYTFEFFKDSSCIGTSIESKTVQGNNPSVGAGPVQESGPSADAGQSYVVKVTITNRAGAKASDCSDPVVRYENPDPPNTLTLTPTGVSGQATLRFSLGGLGGASVGDVGVRVSSGSVTCDALVVGTNSCGVSGLVDGTTPTIEVRVFFSLGGPEYVSAAGSVTASGSVFGLPGAPGVSASKSGTSITFSWGAGTAAGRPVDALQIQIDGGAVESVATGGGGRTVSYGYSETHCVRARAASSGVWSVWSSPACATTDGPPLPPSVTCSPGQVSWCNVGNLNGVPAWPAMDGSRGRMNQGEFAEFVSCDGPADTLFTIRWQGVTYYAYKVDFSGVPC